MYAVKLKLKPTKEQEEYFEKMVHAVIWAYNAAIDIKDYMIEEEGYLPNARTTNSLLYGLRKKEEYAWLREVPTHIIYYAASDCGKGFTRYIRGKGGHPKYKSEKKGHPSFHMRYGRLIGNNCIKTDKVGTLKFKNTTDDRVLKGLMKYGIELKNVRIKSDGQNWWLTFAFEVDRNPDKLTDEVIGIDLGIKNTAILSNGDVFENINKKSRRIRKIEKRKRKINKQIARKYRTNNNTESNNVIKMKETIRKMNKDLQNIRMDYNHKVATKIVRTKPRMIVMETLNIRNMLKNRNIAYMLQQQRLYELMTFIKYKAQGQGTRFIQTPVYFKSTQTCSNCGATHKMELSERTYRCDICGYVEDRDINAAKNLRNFGMDMNNPQIEG